MQAKRHCNCTATKKSKALHAIFIDAILRAFTYALHCGDVQVGGTPQNLSASEEFYSICRPIYNCLGLRAGVFRIGS